MTQVADLLAGLNPAQREAVETVDGPLLIVAGPGSGKTRVITHRIAYLVRECGVSPFSILAMTFTNKAAREMRDRLTRLAGQHADALTVGTFHSFCARLLRRDGDFIGLSRNYSIFDDDDQIAAIKQCLEQADYDPKRYPPRAVLSAISRAKNVLQDSRAMAREADGYYFEEVCARVYGRYEELMARNNAVDFDDLLLRTVQLFREFPVVLQRYQERYGYMMVDEFQDTNVAQYQLARQLSQAHQNFCVVGDPDQSIYSWRSADVRNILNFRADYPRAKLISLGQNYRSTASILNAAKGLIESNGQRLDHELFTDNPTGAPVQMDEAYDEDEEAGKVIGEIKRLTRDEGFKLGDCAVLYRVNAQSRALEEACLQQGVKYRLVGGTRFYQRKEIRDLTAYLRLVFNQQDDMNLSRVVGVPPRGIGARSMQQLGDWASGRGTAMFDAMRQIAEASAAKQPCPVPLPTRAASSIAKFAALVDRWVTLSREVEVVKLIDLILDESGLQKFIQEGNDRPEERWENVMDLPRHRPGIQRRDPARRPRFPAGAHSAGLAGRRTGGRRGLHHSDHAAPGQGTGVPGGVHGRDGGGPAAPFPLHGQRGADGGGAAPLLRRHDPGRKAALPAARLPAGLPGKHGRPSGGVSIPAGDTGRPGGGCGPVLDRRPGRRGAGNWPRQLHPRRGAGRCCSSPRAIRTGAAGW